MKTSKIFDEMLRILNEQFEIFKEGVERVCVTS